MASHTRASHDKTKKYDDCEEQEDRALTIAELRALRDAERGGGGGGPAVGSLSRVPTDIDLSFLDDASLASYTSLTQIGEASAAAASGAAAFPAPGDLWEEMVDGEHAVAAVAAAAAPAPAPTPFLADLSMDLGPTPADIPILFLDNEDGGMRVLESHGDDGGRGHNNWFFTLNNPTDEDETSWRPGKYGMMQVERGKKTGTLHLQGFVIFSSAQRLSGVKKIHPRAYWAPMKGTIEQCEKYCSKDDTAVSPPRRYTWGTRPLGRGKRTDLHDLADIVCEGGAAAAARLMPHMVIKFPAGIRYLEQLRPTRPVISAPSEWRPWQKELLDLLAQKADDRTINWYVDYTGGAGKSTVVRTVCGLGIPCQGVSLSGKIADMAYAYNNEPVVFFDVSRTMAEHMDHLIDMAERLKNGQIFSTKYESRMKFFPSPHVVFFANVDPPVGRWSADRLRLVKLSQPEPFHAAAPVLPPPVAPIFRSAATGGSKRKASDMDDDDTPRVICRECKFRVAAAGCSMCFECM